MEAVILVLCVFIFISLMLMFLKYFQGKDDKGFPYSRDRKRN
jgi:hypothetical protein